MNKDNDNLANNSVTNDINSYEETLQKLQNIVANIENKENSFSELLENVTTANQLVQDCKDKLRGIEKEINLKN